MFFEITIIYSDFLRYVYKNQYSNNFMHFWITYETSPKGYVQNNILSGLSSFASECATNKR